MRRGGFRKPLCQESFYLREPDCEKLVRSAFSAWRKNLPLNRLITISWERAGVPPELGASFTSRFIRLARDWIRYHGTPMPWLWVQEREAFNGQHVHIMLHVPPALDPLFSRMPLQWIKLLMQGCPTGGTLRTDKFRTSAQHTPKAYELELRGRLHYLLKSAPAHLELKFNLVPPGKIRWGISSSVVGPRARVNHSTALARPCPVKRGRDRASGHPAKFYGTTISPAATASEPRFEHPHSLVDVAYPTKQP